MSSKAKKVAKNIQKDKVNKATDDIMEHIMVVGKCNCSKESLVIHYESDKPENVARVFCTRCGMVGDIRDDQAFRYLVPSVQLRLSALYEQFYKDKYTEEEFNAVLEKGMVEAGNMKSDKEED